MSDKKPNYSTGFEVSVDNQEIQAMKEVMARIEQADENLPEDQAMDMIEEIQEFMDRLTDKDCQTFARDVRRMMDDLIEHRMASFNDYPVDSPEYMKQMIQKMTPERKVHLVDTGNMAPEKLQQAIQNLKEEIPTKKLFTGNQTSNNEGYGEDSNPLSSLSNSMNLESGNNQSDLEKIGGDDYFIPLSQNNQKDSVPNQKDTLSNHYKEVLENIYDIRKDMVGLKQIIEELSAKLN